MENFSPKLQAWFLRCRRKMPWRERRNVYNAVVSEFMLQQTQVATVIPYFERWVASWPDFESLANADESEVLHAWEGLGYYSRARNLHALAKQIVEQKSFPQNARDWRQFKGVGDYTAAAISSIVQGERIAVVDGNVVRILARVTAEKTLFKDNSSAVKFFAPLAQKLVPEKHAGVHNEAMMELGATLCTKANPRCGICPIAEFCRSRGNAEAAQLPRFLAKKIKKVEISRAFVVTGTQAILLQKIDSKNRRLRALFELPKLEDLWRAGVSPASTPQKPFAEFDLLLRGKRAIAQESITELIFRVPENCVPAMLPPEIVPVKISEIPHITFSGPHRKWISQLLAGT